MVSHVRLYSWHNWEILPISANIIDLHDLVWIQLVLSSPGRSELLGSSEFWAGMQLFELHCREQQPMLELVCSVFQFWPEEKSFSAYWVWERDPLKSVILIFFSSPSNRENRVFWEWRWFLELISPKKTSLEPGMLTLLCSLFWLANLRHCCGSGSRITWRPSSNRDCWVPLQILIESVMLNAVQRPQFVWGLDLVLLVVSRLVLPMGWLLWGNWFWSFWFFAVEKIQFGNKSVLILIYYLKHIPSLGKNASAILFLRNLHNSLAYIG